MAKHSMPQQPGRHEDQPRDRRCRGKPALITLIACWITIAAAVSPANTSQRSHALR
ncbi:MAG TPA: hypothetical protein VES62_05890 [Thermoleophilaceae bacterium]|nr:hypothetical protein [Thermoleophilaceae bacterium]